MARLATFGAELLQTATSASELSQGINYGTATGRLPGSYCLVLGGFSAASPPGTRPYLNFTALSTYEMRGFFKILQFPTGGNGLRILGGNCTVEGTDDAWYLVLNTDGTINGYNKGNGSKLSLAMTTAALSLNVWYRINVVVRFAAADAVTNIAPACPGGIHTTLHAAGSLGLTIAGLGDYAGGSRGPVLTDDCTNSPTTSDLSGLNHAGGLGGTVYLGPTSTGGTERDGGIIAWDDVVIGHDIDPPGNGGITCLHVTGPGTDAGWTTGGDYRCVIKRPPDDRSGAAPDRLTNTTPGAATTFTLETLASKRLASVTIKSVRVCAYGEMVRNNWKYRIRKNGTVTDSAAQFGPAGSSGGTWLDAQSEPGGGWFLDAATLSLTPSDTVEIGIVDGPSGAGTAGLWGVHLLVDWEGSDPAPASETADIEAKSGTATGNGTVQDIAFDDATFKPTLLLIEAATTDPGARAIWCRGWGEDGDYAMCASSNANSNAGICRVYTGGFSVKGGASSLNASGAPFRWLAIRDNAMRMIASGLQSFNPNSGSDAAFDNYTVALPDASFVLDALLVAAQQFRATTTGRFRYRDTTYTGDASSSLMEATAANADGIQSQGTGTFQIGTVLTQSSIATTAWVAVSKAAGVFSIRRLIDSGMYTGNGAGPRVMPFTVDTVPSFVLVVPEDSGDRYYRFFNDGAGTTSRRFTDGGTSTTAITAFDTANQFTVNATLNANLVKYHYLVFGSGVDPTEIELADGGIGLTWVELTDRAGDLHVWSKVALPDPSTYFGGYKDDRVVTWGRLSRALSDRAGQFEATDFSWTVADTDRALRSLLSTDATKFFRNRPAVVRMIDDASWRLKKTPRTVIRGYVDDYQPDARLGFTFKAQDLLTAKFAAVGQKPATVPTRLITAADFPACPADTLTRPVPVIYGQVSDTNIVGVPGPSAGVVALDLTAPVVQEHVMNAIPGTLAYQLGNPAGRPVWATLVAIRNGVAGPSSDVMTTAPWLFGNPPDPLATTGVKISWNHVEQAQSYRLYVADASDFDPFGSKGTATKARYIDHDITTFDGAYGRNFSIDLSDWTVGTDALGPPTTVMVDQGKGAYPPIYVGDQIVATTNYHKFLVAGHTVKSIDELYVEANRLKLQTDATIAGAGGAWLVPGYQGWADAFGATRYEVVNGHRYTVIYGRVGNILADRAAGTVPLMGSDTVPLALSVQGIEAMGDGTGALITNLHVQYLHILQNWILRTYQDGAWLTTPAFEDDPDLLQIDEDSFAAVQTIAAQRLSGGYVGAGVLGADGEVLTIRDLIARLNLSADVDSGFNRKCPFMISMVDESIGSLHSAVPLTDVLHIFSESFSVKDDLGSHANIIPVTYARDYSGRADTPGGAGGGTTNGWLHAFEARDSTSITNYTTGDVTGEFPAPALELQFVRHQATAEDVAFRRLLRQKDPPRVVTFALGLTGMNYELGDVLSLTHYEGVGPSGWVGNPVRILRHDADPDQFQVVLECVDMQTLFAGAFILGNESVLPSAWTSATTAQKQYGYLAEETTGLFSEGSKGKRLR